MRGLYAILDVAALERARLDVSAVAEVILEAKPACLQLRAKELAPRATLKLLREIGALARRSGTPLFANDRPDLALLAECDGVHVGQDDLAPADVRAIAASSSRDLRVGLSTHNENQVRAALEMPIDYLAIGPVFSTTNKSNPELALGLDAVRALASLARAARPELPIVAIGGMNRSRALELAGCVDMVAVIGALLPNEPMSGKAALDSIRKRANEMGFTLMPGAVADRGPTR